MKCDASSGSTGSWNTNTSDILRCHEVTHMYMYVLRQTRSTTISIPYYDDQFPAERWREVILEMTNVIVSHVRGCIKHNEVLRSATCLRVRSNANYRFHRPEMSNESISATWRIQRNLLLLMVKLLFQLSLVWKWSKDGNDLWRKWQREMYIMDRAEYTQRAEVKRERQAEG